MGLGDWIQDKFGNGQQTLLDEEFYPDKELKRDKRKIEQQHKELEREMGKLADEYRSTLEEAASAPEYKQRAMAQKAKLKKKKWKIQKKKYKANSLKLGTLVTIEGARDLIRMTDNSQGSTLEIDRLLEQDEASRLQMQEVMSEAMVEFGLELDDFKEIEEALDIPITQTDMEMETDEEMETIKAIEKGQLSAEQLDLEAEDVEATEDDLYSEPDVEGL
jgi:hypothetical protein